MAAAKKHAVCAKERKLHAVCGWLLLMEITFIIWHWHADEMCSMPVLEVLTRLGSRAIQLQTAHIQLSVRAAVSRINWRQCALLSTTHCLCIRGFEGYFFLEKNINIACNNVAVFYFM